MQQLSDKPAGQSKRTQELEETLNFLMNRFSYDDSPWLASSIVSHLEELADRPDSVALGNKGKLLPYWRRIEEQLTDRKQPRHGWQISVPTIQRWIRTHQGAFKDVSS